jgi:ubiquinol-cytochrome c reductase cytochrome c1 subunit
MAPQLTDGRVTYDDGVSSRPEQMAKDVATFLEWAGDPHATERKQTGLAVLIYLLIFACVTYVAYITVWKDKH